MKILLLSLPEQPERTARAIAELAKHNLGCHIVTAINGYKTGLVSTHPYDHDHPGTNYVIGPATIGIFLTHYMAWAIADALPDEMVCIMEDDVVLCANFNERFQKAVFDSPEDFDMLFLGSCCARDHVHEHIRGEVYDVRYPQCLHAYVLKKKAAKTLMTNYRDVYGPVDCLLRLNGYAGLKVLTVLPRMAEQMNTELPL